MSVKWTVTPASAGRGAVGTRTGNAKRVGRDRALYDVIRFIRPLHRALAKSVDDRLEGTGITVGIRAVLEVIDAAGPKTVPQIGRVLAIGRQPVQRTVNAASALGLLELADNPAHKRSALVGLTAAGEAAFLKVRAREQQVLKRIARRVAAPDIEACVRVLAALTDEFQQIAYGEDDHG